MPVTEIILDGKHRGPLTFSLDQREMTVIAYEALHNVRRPPGYTVDRALSEISANSPQSYEAACRIAGRMLDYVEEKVRSAQPEPLQ